ncbi:hypothetical protein HK097_003578 [Rhizophlyctis rosea]|uniref:Uncharacterized protein n=1 Tax=Rhizophlyctis rosea TaxID=64517 RepID=A0AAD5S2E2_9FUNG|nr:hypothetical protein HK097_003578 [Rhizophlyctis rosea]
MISANNPQTPIKSPLHSYSFTPSRIASNVPLTPSAIDSVTLGKQLRDALWTIQERDREIEQKDADLKLAAELGFQLMANNESLKTEYERVLSDYQSAITASSSSSPSPTPSLISNPTDETLHKIQQKRADATTAARIADLECALLDLQSKNDTLKTDLRLSQESERSYASKIKRMEVETNGMKQDLENALAQVQELSEDRIRLQKDKSDLTKRLKESNQVNPKHQNQEETIDTLRNQLSDLEHLVITLHTDRTHLESALSDSESQNTHLQSSLDSLNQLLESQREDIESYQSSTTSLSHALESSRDLISKLESRLAILSPDGEADTGDKTLLSEIEDRRKELEERYKTLGEKHVGLVKAHGVSVVQRERMRNHIARLQQLGVGGGSKCSDERVKALEEALGFSEGENRDLVTKITLLERKMADVGRFCGTESEEGDRNEELESMRIRIAQLGNENLEVGREVRTLRMVGKFEIEKRRKVEGLLREREDEVGRLKAQMAQVRFEFEEFKLRVRAGEEGVGFVGGGENAGVVNGKSEVKKASVVVSVNESTQTDISNPTSTPTPLKISQSTQTHISTTTIDVDSDSDSDVGSEYHPSLSSSSRRPDDTFSSSFCIDDNRSVDLAELSTEVSSPVFKPPLTPMKSVRRVDGGGGSSTGRNSVRASLGRGSNGIGNGNGGGKAGPAQVFVGRGNVRSEECKQQ